MNRRRYGKMIAALKTHGTAGKSKESWEFCVALGEPAFRGAQIFTITREKFDVRQITNLPSACASGCKEARSPYRR